MHGVWWWWWWWDLHSSRGFKLRAFCSFWGVGGHLGCETGRAQSGLAPLRLPDSPAVCETKGCDMLQEKEHFPRKTPPK